MMTIEEITTLLDRTIAQREQRLRKHGYHCPILEHKAWTLKKALEESVFDHSQEGR